MGNMFGGKNENGLYVPLSEDEQETLSRLVDEDYLELVVENWPTPPSDVQYILGDLRVGIKFSIACSDSRIQQFLRFLDLHLRIRQGLSLFREIKKINPPILLRSDLALTFQWDIALHHISSEVVKAIKPGALGLTSRRQDRDTKKMTQEGNMHLSSMQKQILQSLEEGAKNVREKDKLENSQEIEK